MYMLDERGNDDHDAVALAIAVTDDDGYDDDNKKRNTEFQYYSNKI